MSMPNRAVLESRARLLALVLLSLLHGIATDGVRVAILLGLSTLLCVLYRKELARGLAAIALGIIVIPCIFAISVLFGASVSLQTAGIELARWVSLVLSTVVLFLSFSLIELMQSLAFFKCPARISLAVGVGLRFLPSLVSDAVLVHRIQRMRRAEGASMRLSRLLPRLESMFLPLVYSTLRRVADITVSIEIQQVIERIAERHFPRWRAREWLVLGFLAVMCIEFVISRQ